jgi:hypothetical protein
MRTIEDFLTFLRDAGIPYKIGLPGGVVEYQPERLRNRRGYGSVADYVRPFVENLQRGESVVIPSTEGNLNNCISSLAARLWGNGAYRVQWNRKTRENTVTRL